MPELPEVETTKRGLAPTLEGSLFEGVTVNFPKLRYPIPNLQPVIGKKISKIDRRAKYLVIYFADAPAMVIHLGMSGSMLICDKTTPIIKHDHVVFTLPNNKELRYNDPRRFGSILLYENAELEKFLNSHGLEPLSAEFNAETLYKILQKKPNANLKTTIMDGKLVVGVGNIYACESLFICGISPLKKAGEVTKKQAQQLCMVIKDVLEKSIQAGGSSLKDFKHSDGKLGYFQNSHKVYGRMGEKCTTCSTPIERVVIGQRSTFYCPRCQK